MGCTVRKNRHGYLCFRLYVDGLESLEGTKLKDSPENREKVEARARVIDQEMREGSFDYLKWFPFGNLASRYQKVEEPGQIITARGFFRSWTENDVAGTRSVSAKWRSNRKSYIRVHVLPTLGGMHLDQLKTRDLVELQASLRTKGLADATVDRVIHSALRGFLRDAGVAGYQVPDLDELFDRRLLTRVDLGRESHTIDAFSDDEREAILKHFREHEHAHYPFVFFRFWTGTRPSEAIALRWRAVDLPRRRLRILASRVLGRDGRPKTGKSKREVLLHQEVVDLLERIRPADVEPDTFVFRTPSGTPLDETNFSTRVWVPALRAAKVRARPFYNTRHTYISWLLDHGARPLFVCRQTGTSLEMIERHYGDARVTPDQLDRLGEVRESTPVPG